MNNKTPISLHGSEGISGIEAKRPNIVTKDAPIALRKFRGSGSCLPGNRDTKYVLIVNHNIIYGCIMCLLSIHPSSDTWVDSNF